MNDAQTSALRINEIYLSIQGESTFAGLPCVFVRTSGCPLRCRWCDTEYAFAGGTPISGQQLLEQVLAHDDVELVEVTGGEPLVQPAVLPLMEALCDAGKTVLLETSGAYDIAGVDSRVHIILDVKCPDSGEAARNRPQNLTLLRAKDEVKFVLASRADYEFARELIVREQLWQRCAVLISTAFGALEPRDVVEWMLADGLRARFQLQLHKLIWPPDQRGV